MEFKITRFWFNTITRNCLFITYHAGTGGNCIINMNNEEQQFVDEELKEEEVVKPALPEAPISINIKGYYKGFSVGLTKRIDGDSLAPHLNGILAIINQMDTLGFKPSWNDATNKNFEKPTIPEVQVSSEQCPHPVTKTLVAKTEKNMGKSFKTCETCKKFLGWVK